MTDLTEAELQAWVAEQQPLLDQRNYEHPAAFALGAATIANIDGESVCIEVKFLPSAVNVGATNELTLALLNKHALHEDDVVVPGTHRLSAWHIGKVLGEYPEKLVKSATPTHHGNVWALQQLLTLVTPDSERPKDLLNRRRVPVLHISTDLMVAPASLEEVYLRLMTQTLRKTMPMQTSAVRPGEAFDLLENVVWTPKGVFTLDEYDRVEGMALASGNEIPISHQDKLPRLLDYVRPPGVRIADGNRCRLGAYLSPGTTFMHEGFANFNAATLGQCMIEGRISAGVSVGAHSDLGGGVSTMGTMSGGNNLVISVGEYCLLEAEAILGIPIGDRVRVEAGLPLKSTRLLNVGGTAQEWAANDGMEIDWTRRMAEMCDRGEPVKAMQLAGVTDAIFRVNSLSGAMEVIPRSGRDWGGLNAALHAN